MSRGRGTDSRRRRANSYRRGSAACSLTSPVRQSARGTGRAVGRWAHGRQDEDWRWLKPVLVCRAEFVEWTPDNHPASFAIRRVERRKERPRSPLGRALEPRFVRRIRRAESGFPLFYRTDNTFVILSPGVQGWYAAMSIRTSRDCHIRQ
jgi:hypothetical protein